MVEVVPTFAEPVATDHTVTAIWGVNGDTPLGFRIYTKPNSVAEFIDVGLSVNNHQWQGLPSATTYMRFSVACIYPAPTGLKIGGFLASTTGAPAPPPPPPPPPPPVGNFRAVPDPARQTITLTWDRVTDPRTSEIALRRDVDVLLVSAVLGSTPDPGRFVDAHLAPGTYTYRLRTFVATGQYTEVTQTVQLGSPPAMPPLPRPMAWRGPEEVRGAGVATPFFGCVSARPDRIDVFWCNLRNPAGPGLNPDRARVWHASYTTATGWSAVEKIPLPRPVGTMAAGSSRPDHIDLVFDATLHLHGTLAADGTIGWAEPVPITGGSSGPGRLASATPGRLDLFYRASDGRVGQRVFDGATWGAEYLHDMRTLSRPAVIAPKPGRLEVYRLDPDGRLLRRRVDLGGQWSTDLTVADDVLFTPYPSAPTVASAGDGSGAEVVYTTTANQIRHRSLDAEGATARTRTLSSSAMFGYTASYEIFCLSAKRFDLIYATASTVLLHLWALPAPGTPGLEQP